MQNIDIEAINAQIRIDSAFLEDLKRETQKVIVGQEQMIDRLLLGLLTNGHVLLEGLPGLAKTMAIKALSKAINSKFSRIQFTPDLLPADIIGTMIYNPSLNEFTVRKGPIFANFILTDEINRAPAKVQSALLEAMQEKQVTIGNETFFLEEPFLVLATQNPIEQEGTYPLPEAQLDRFLMCVTISYPDEQVERDILSLARQEAIQGFQAASSSIEPLSQALIFQARQQVLQVHTSPALEQYIVQLVIATRHPDIYGEALGRWLRFGASPRATIALDRCSKAHAWLAGRDFVTPEDIHAIAHEVLRHRILLTYEAEAEGVRSDEFISELLRRVAVP